MFLNEFVQQYTSYVWEHLDKFEINLMRCIKYPKSLFKNVTNAFIV